MAETLTFRVMEFSGPLDLLLSLITARKMNIYDIPIAEILEQYLEQIARMRENNMEVASEFMAMAARLIYIKTAQLLPEENKVADDLKKKLTEELLEYRLVKLASEDIRGRWNGGGIFVRPPTVLPGKSYDRLHPPEDLVAAYSLLAKKIVQKEKGARNMTRFSEELAQKPVSVADRVSRLIDRLAGGGELEYSRLYEPEDTPSGKVATFLALLELMKVRFLILRQEEDGTQYFRMVPPETDQEKETLARLTEEGWEENGEEAE